MFHAEPATLEDVDYILDNLSSVTLTELSIIEMNMAGYRAYIEKHFLAAETIYDDNTPVCTIGYDFRGTDVYTWFLATDKFFKSHKSISFGREYMKRVKNRFPNRDIFSISAMPRTDTDRWFRIMGAKQVGGQDIFVLYQF